MRVSQAFTTCCLLGLFAFFAGSAGAQKSNAPDAESLRPSTEELLRVHREMRRLKQERRLSEESRSVVELEETLEDSPLAKYRREAGVGQPVHQIREDQSVLLLVRNEMDSLRGLVQLRRHDAETTRTLQLPLVLKSDHWLILEPGAWRLDLSLTTSERIEPEVLPPQEYQLKAGKRYRLSLGEQTERQLKQFMGFNRSISEIEPESGSPVSE